MANGSPGKIRFPDPVSDHFASSLSKNGHNCEMVMISVRLVAFLAAPTVCKMLVMVVMCITSASYSIALGSWLYGCCDCHLLSSSSISVTPLATVIYDHHALIATFCYPKPLTGLEVYYLASYGQLRIQSCLQLRM